EFATLSGMRYRPLGNTGLSVSAVGLGGVALSIPATRPDQATAIKVIHHAIDRGVTFIDTADSYGQGEADMGHNERLFRAALAQLPADVRARVVVATKGGHARPGGAWVPNGRPEYLRQQCEASLRNLGVDCLDLLQHHRPDPDVPIADSIGAYARLRDEGKVRFIGVSEYSVAQLDEAQSVTAIASTQNQYSPAHRQPERDGTLAATAQRGLAFIPWSPLGGTGQQGAGNLARRHPDIARLAEHRGVSPQRLVLAWLLAKGAHVLVIVGASRAATIEDSARAADLDLDAGDVARIDAATA
ncbi:MAG: aldo/keto reductase, partial [Spirochaetaceae bacterium]|nr:aldo/keto reductase [Spirochaetaceae bacterium]